MSRRKYRHLTPERLQALREFATRLGLTVDDEKLRLLHRALTTAAWTKRHGGPNNEWLEWYGDAVWHHAASELTLETFPSEKRVLAHEGWRMRLKSGERQTRLARELGLECLVLLPDGYRPVAHGVKVETAEVLLGSALEALIGAIASWSIREAMRVAKALMQRSLAEMPLMLARYVQSTDHDRHLDISSREQLRGYTRMLIFLTRKIMAEEATLTLKGAWGVRHQALSVRGLGLLGRRALLADHGQSDVQAMQRLLSAAGQGPKLSPAIKTALEAVATQAVRSVKDARGFAQTTPSEAPRDPLGELRTLLNGHAVLTSEASPHGGGVNRAVRVRCFVNGQFMGQGIDPDLGIARKKAAEAVLANPALENVRRTP